MSVDGGGGFVIAFTKGERSQYVQWSSNSQPLLCEGERDLLNINGISHNRMFLKSSDGFSVNFYSASWISITTNSLLPTAAICLKSELLRPEAVLSQQTIEASGEESQGNEPRNERWWNLGFYLMRPI